MYVFDKDGEWHDEGIYHDSLNMEATYNETQWYDEFNPHNFMWAIQHLSIKKKLLVLSYLKQTNEIVHSFSFYHSISDEKDCKMFFFSAQLNQLLFLFLSPSSLCAASCCNLNKSSTYPLSVSDWRTKDASSSYPSISSESKIGLIISLS